MFALSNRWIEQLVAQPETGPGYHVVSIVLNDGRRYDQVVVDSGYVTTIRGEQGIPFGECDITGIIVTHDKWDFHTS